MVVLEPHVREEMLADLLVQALAGSESALKELVDELTPIIQVTVARALRSRDAARGGRSIQQDIEEYVQEVFEILFQNDAEHLRRWDPNRSTLKYYVRMITATRTVSALRASHRRPWHQEQPVACSDLAAIAPAAVDAESALTALDLWQRAVHAVRDTLDAAGQSLFDLIFVHDCSVSEIQRATSLSPDAIYQRRSRYKRRLRDHLNSLRADH